MEYREILIENPNILLSVCKWLSERELLALESVCQEVRVVMQEHCAELWRWRCEARWDELRLATSIEPHEWKGLYARKHQEGTDFNAFMNIKQLRNCDWYSCPNGHLYLIGECRLPMKIGKCPTCGVKIGGKSHRMIDNNQRLGRVKRDPSGMAGLSLDQLTADQILQTADQKDLARARQVTPTMKAEDAPSESNPSRPNKRKRKQQRRKEYQKQQNANIPPPNKTE